MVDLNLLIYASNEAAPLHASALKWWKDVLEGESAVGLAWIAVLGYLRISTNPNIFPRPLKPESALAVVDGWLSRSNVTLLRPGDRHWSILQRLVRLSGTAGNLTTDAHLAALAIEHSAVLCSTDANFTRFAPELRSKNPLKN